MKLWEPPYTKKPDVWLLDRIDEALGEGDRHSVQLYIIELQRRGVYPLDTVPGNSSTVERMVEFYGSRWYTWEGKNECPHCGADLRNHEAGPPFKRELARYDPEKDRTTHLICPDCGIDLAAGPTFLEHILETS